MLNIFVGMDDRIPIQTHVCMSSIARRASKPVALTPLRLSTLPLKRKGLTSFSFARFLVPYLMGYKGRALFLDGDIAVNCDVAELFDHADQDHAVYVSEVHPQFERAAVILFQCDHPHNSILTPEFVEKTDLQLHMLGWTDRIGTLPMNANFCIGYAKHRPLESVMVAHWTMGVPVWPITADSEHADFWHNERRAMCAVRSSWEDLMGASVHSKPGPDGQPIPKYKG